MLKKTKSISLNILSIFTILISLLCAIVGSSSSWFTSQHNKGIKLVVTVNDLNLHVFQARKAGNVELKTKLENANANETSPEYIEYEGDSGLIEPDGDYGLNLYISNSEAGTPAIYVRFKFFVYANGVDIDTNMPCTVSGADATAGAKGFVYSNGYYYLKESSAANAKNATVAQGTTQTLFTHFNVPLSSFMDDNGSFVINGGETLKFELQIEASVTDFVS